VIRVSVGLGSGETEMAKAKPTGHRGRGGGVDIEPLGFLVTKGEKVSFISTSQSRNLSGVFEKVPDMLLRFIELRKKRKKPGAEAN
jgi:uncharacterized spore protein YtfJ